MVSWKWVLVPDQHNVKFTLSLLDYIGCPTIYQTRQFFNNSKTNEDIATRFEQEYVRCVRNEKECVCNKIMSVCV